MVPAKPGTRGNFSGDVRLARACAVRLESSFVALFLHNSPRFHHQTSSSTYPPRWLQRLLRHRGLTCTVVSNISLSLRVFLDCQRALVRFGSAMRRPHEETRGVKRKQGLPDPGVPRWRHQPPHIAPTPRYSSYCRRHGGLGPAICPNPAATVSSVPAPSRNSPITGIAEQHYLPEKATLGLHNWRLIDSFVSETCH